MLKKGYGSQIKYHKKKDKVVLLIHCFRNSPRIFSELSETLFQNGFSIYNLRLPGHGCKDENEIFKIKLRDWESYIENIFLDLTDNFDSVYCCGLSIGSSFVFNLAMKYKNIEKIVAISPFLRFRQKRAVLSGIIKYFIRKIEPSKPDCSIDNDILKEFIPFLPIPQSYEIYKLSSKTRKNISKISSKVLCFLSKNDHDMNYEDQIKILKKTDFEIITLEKSKHLSVIDVEKDYVINTIADWFRAV